MDIPARKRIAAAALALTGLFHVAAHADEQAMIVNDGLYTFQATRWHGTYGQPAGCLILSDGGRDIVPTLYHWGGSGWCGLSDTSAGMLANRQAVWSIRSITASDGRRAHIVRSHLNGLCLIRGNNGTAVNPSLYLWGLPGGDANFCGFRNADEVIQNGQAAWYFYGLQIGGSAWMKDVRVFGQSLAFGPIPVNFPNTLDRFSWATFPGGNMTSSTWEFNLYRMD